MAPPAVSGPPLKAWQRTAFQTGVFISLGLLCVGLSGILILTGTISEPYASPLCALYTTLEWQSPHMKPEKPCLSMRRACPSEREASAGVLHSHLATCRADTKDTLWLTKTPYGTLWRNAMNLHTIVLPAITNAGIIGAAQLLSTACTFLQDTRQRGRSLDSMMVIIRAFKLEFAVGVSSPRYWGRCGSMFTP
jgi:hypothetical protein